MRRHTRASGVCSIWLFIVMDWHFARLMHAGLSAAYFDSGACCSRVFASLGNRKAGVSGKPIGRDWLEQSNGCILQAEVRVRAHRSNSAPPRKRQFRFVSPPPGLRLKPSLPGLAPRRKASISRGPPTNPPQETSPSHGHFCLWVLLRWLQIASGRPCTETLATTEEAGLPL